MKRVSALSDFALGDSIGYQLDSGEFLMGVAGARVSGGPRAHGGPIDSLFVFWKDGSSSIVNQTEIDSLYKTVNGLDVMLDLLP